jgi:hypothetical protein
MKCFATVDEEDIFESVAVEIQERHPATHGFNQKTIRRLTAELLPVDARPLRDVSENLRCRF